MSEKISSFNEMSGVEEIFRCLLHRTPLKEELFIKLEKDEDGSYCTLFWTNKVVGNKIGVCLTDVDVRFILLHGNVQHPVLDIVSGQIHLKVTIETIKTIKMVQLYRKDSAYRFTDADELELSLRSYRLFYQMIPKLFTVMMDSSNMLSLQDLCRLSIHKQLERSRRIRCEEQINRLNLPTSLKVFISFGPNRCEDWVQSSHYDDTHLRPSLTQPIALVDGIL